MEATKAATTLGTISIDFAATGLTKEELVENFSDYLVKVGAVNLTNMDDDKVRLDIFNHEFTYFDDEGE